MIFFASELVYRADLKPRLSRVALLVEIAGLRGDDAERRGIVRVQLLDLGLQALLHVQLLRSRLGSPNSDLVVSSKKETAD